MNQQTSDQPLVRRARGVHGPWSARTVLRVVLMVVAGVAFLPNVAVAHDYENPGFNGARLYVEMYEGTVSVVDNGLVVKGMDFVAEQHVEIFQCPSSAPTDPRLDCVMAGRAQTDATGAFEAEVIVSAGMPTKDTYCAPVGTSQCHMVAATYAAGRPTEMTSDAEHHLCFAEHFAWTFFPAQYFPERKPYEECAGPPEPTVTTTTTTVPFSGQWEPAAPMNVARQGLATAVAPDGRIYALGGSDGPPAGAGNTLSSGEAFDPCGKRTWEPIAPMPTARTDFAAATGPDGRIYAIGGRASSYSGTPLASVDAYDPTTNTWSTVASLAMPRAGLAAATGPDGLIYAIGGKVAGNAVAGVGTADGYAVQSVEAYDTATNKWTPVTPLPSNPLNMEIPLLDPNSFGAATGPDGRVYAVSAGPFGSYDSALAAGPGPVQSYSPGPEGTPGIWQKEVAPTGQGFALPPFSAVTTGPDGRIYDLGGLDQSSLRGVLVFDTVADTWTMSQEALTARRSHPGAAAGRDGRLYAIGGVDSGDEVDPQVLASTEAARVAPNACPAGPPPPADFDGDGDTDISVFRPSTGTWFAKDGATSAWGAEGDIPVPGDYDGDRKADVAIFRPSVGLWAIDHSSGGPDTFVTYGIATDVPVPADYDGDGKTDIAVYRPDYATWWVHQSSDGTDTARTFGLPTDVPVPGDYDGDAKADLGIFRDGTWFVQPASGGAYSATTYGIAGDIPVPGDYDADHTTDMAVFRPSGGMWALHRSSDGVDEIFGFGNSGDVPVAGDYNADGITDPAVFRSGEWFIETGQSASWGTATDIPLPLPPAVRLAFFA